MGGSMTKTKGKPNSVSSKSSSLITPSSSSKQKTAIFPITGNPPTFGNVLSFMNICDKYDKIYVVVRDKTYVMSSAQSKNLLESVLCKFTPKFSVLKSKHDFKNDTTFEGMPPYDDILTTDVEVYANLTGKGYDNAILVPSPIGWDDTFHRVAYCRSAILNRIRNEMVTIPLQQKKKRK